PMLGRLFAAVFAEMIGPRAGFLVLGVIALVALPVALRLSSGPGHSFGATARRLTWPSPLDLWAFVQGLTLDGVFVVGLSVLAPAGIPEGATVAGGGSRGSRSCL